MPNGPCSEALNILQKLEHGNFMKFSSGKCQVPHLGRIPDCHIPVHTGSQLPGKHFCSKRTQGSIWKSWAWGSNMHLQWRKPTAHLRRSTANGLRRVVSPFTSALRRHTTAWHWRSSSSPPSSGKVRKNRLLSTVSSKRLKISKTGYSTTLSVQSSLVFKHPGSKTVLFRQDKMCLWAPLRSRAPSLHPPVSMNKYR